MEAAWFESLVGLIDRCGSFGGLMTAGEDVFLSDESGGTVGRARKKKKNLLLWKAMEFHH